MYSDNGQDFSYFPEGFDKTMQIIEPTYDQHIFKPPERNVTQGRIAVVLAIDSRDRDLEQFPSPSEYIYHMEHTIRNVISIELVKGCIPHSDFNITESCNKIFFEESWGLTLAICIEPGIYTIEELVKELEQKFNESENTESIYEIKLNKRRKRITIESNLAGGDHIFRLINRKCTYGTICDDCFKCTLCLNKNDPKDCHTPQGSILTKLGFKRKNVAYACGIVKLTRDFENGTVIIGLGTKFLNEFSEGEIISFENDDQNSYTIKKIKSQIELILKEVVQEDLNKSRIYLNQHVADFSWNLDGEKYIILDILEAKRLESNNKNLDGAFNVILLTSEPGTPTFITAGLTERRGEIKYYNPPLPKLDRMTIKFLKHNGDIFDFNGLDHLLEFNIISLNSPGKYNTLPQNE